MHLGDERKHQGGHLRWLAAWDIGLMAQHMSEGAELVLNE